MHWNRLAILSLVLATTACNWGLQEPLACRATATCPAGSFCHDSGYCVVGVDDAALPPSDAGGSDRLTDASNADVRSDIGATDQASSDRVDASVPTLDAHLPDRALRDTSQHDRDSANTEAGPRLDAVVSDLASVDTASESGKTDLGYSAPDVGPTERALPETLRIDAAQLDACVPSFTVAQSAFTLTPLAQGCALEKEFQVTRSCGEAITQNSCDVDFSSLADLASTCSMACAGGTCVASQLLPFTSIPNEGPITGPLAMHWTLGSTHSSRSTTEQLSLVMASSAVTHTVVDEPGLAARDNAMEGQQVWYRTMENDDCGMYSGCRGPGGARGSIAAGANFTCALNADTSVSCWGANDKGQLGRGTSIAWSHIPVRVRRAEPRNALLMGVVAIAAGDAHACALLAGGEVRCWGDNFYGQLGDWSLAASSLAVVVTEGVSPFSNAYAIATGGDTTCAVKVSGLFCWGSNDAHKFGSASHSPQDSYTQPHEAEFSGVARLVSVGETSVCALFLRAGGTWEVECRGSPDGRLSGSGCVQHNDPGRQDVCIPDVWGVVSGYDHSCALEPSGTVWCWGNNGDGQAGCASSNCARAELIIGIQAGVALAAGEAFGCGLSSSGTIHCWGDNFYHQLGGSFTGFATTTAQHLTDLDGAIAITAGGKHACALLPDGMLKCWGRGTSGQLGVDPTLLEVCGTDRCGTQPQATCVARTDAGACRAHGGAALRSCGQREIILE